MAELSSGGTCKGGDAVGRQHPAIGLQQIDKGPTRERLGLGQHSGQSVF